MTNPTLQLLIANLKMLLRDKQALFWSVLFPAMFLLVFGLFGFDQPVNYDIAIFDSAANQASAELIKGIESVDVITHKTDVTDITEAKDMVKSGDLDAVLVIPANFGQPPAEGTDPLAFSLTINEADVQSGILVSVFNQFLDELTFQMTDTSRLFTLETEGVQGKNVRYIEFLMPGILGMGIMFSSVIGIAAAIAQLKERKIFKRLRATPITPSTFLIAEVGSHLILVLVQILFILAIGMLLFKIHIYGSMALLILAALIGAIPFLILGFFVGGWASTAQAAESMANAFTTPMMFLSGVFFSPDMLPAIVAKIVDFLPLTPMLKILRGIAIDGNTFADFPYQFAIIGGWIVLAFILASRTFRFERQ